MSTYKIDIVGRTVINIYKSLFAILMADSIVGFFVPTQFVRFFELFCLIYACAQYYKLHKKKALLELSPALSWLYYVFVGISLCIICRANWNLGFKDNIMLLISKGNTLVYLCPLLILRLPNKEYISQIFNVFYKACLFVIPIWLLNYDGLVLVKTDTPWAGEAIGCWVPFLAAFFLGYIHRFSQNKKILIYAIWFIYLILMVLNARRNVSFTLVLYFVIAYIYRIFTYDNSSKRFLKIILAFAVFISVYASSDYIFSSVFKEMGIRMTEDTRSGVEESFLLDYYSAPPVDWVLGRGMEGEYACVTINSETHEVFETRNVIETGYLQMLLKGGLSYAIVILVFMILALRSLFKYNRNESYFMGIILLTYFVDNYTTNPISSFGPRAILFWFIISYCLAEYRKK